MGVWSKLRGKGRGDPKILQKRRRAGSWADALEHYGEAAGIAQEGQPAQARNLLLEHLLEPRKILVVTGQGGESFSLRDYASSLAARMGCEIWHLICVKPKSPSAWKDCVWDKANSRQKEIFLEGDVGSCIQQALCRLKRVEFVLMERDEPERLQVAVPVFTLLSRAAS